MSQDLGLAFACIAVGRGTGNNLQVIGLGREDSLPYLAYQDESGEWYDAGCLVEDNETPWSILTTCKGNSNLLQVIGLGREDGLPYLIYQDSQAAWHNTGQLIEEYSTPWSVLATGKGNSNLLQVIGLGREDSLPYLIWQDGEGGWHDVGRLLKDYHMPWSSLATGNVNSDLLYVIGLGREDGLPYLIWQDGKGGWHDGGPLIEHNTTPWSDLVIGRGSSNFLQVIGLGREDGLPYLIDQDNQGIWHDSGRLMKNNNTPWSKLVAHNDDRNNLYVIGLGRDDGLPYLIWQDDKGVWHDGGRLLNEYNTPWSTLVAGMGNANSLQVIGLGRDDSLASLIFKDNKGDYHNYGLLPFGGLRLERPLKPGEVLIYSEENHQGREWLISKDTSNLDRYFTVASFRIGPKTGVTLFSDSEYKGFSQELTAELGSFDESKLQDQIVKSLKIWLSAGKAFTGYWVIEAAEGQYLSVQHDTNGVGVLSTCTSVFDSELFKIKDRGQAGPGRQKAAFQVRKTRNEEQLPALQPQTLTIDDLQNVTVVDEQEMGFRKFSLLVGGLWIYYEPEENRFRTTAEAQKRTVFCQSIKIAQNETQIGELGLGEVALYENPCYWGKAWVFYKDYADFKRVVDLNDEVSSIQLGPLTGATIYRDEQFTADDPKAGKQDVISSIPSLAKEQVGDDQISSIDLWRITPPESLNISFTCSLSQDFRGAGGTFEEYSAYRTTVRLPPTVGTVDVWTTDATEIEVDNQTYQVDEDNPVTLQPNLVYSLVITTDAKVSTNAETPRGSLRAPGLKIRTNTMLSHERIVIFPDQEVHARLADLKEDELWNATFKDRDGNPQYLIKDRSPQKQIDTANAQNMITKIMSTVKYSKSAYGGDEQSIAPEELHGQYWALDFSTFRVKAVTLYVREGPGTDFKQVGFLRKNDIVEALEFNQDASWIRLRRLSDGLMGWSSRIYMDKIADRPLTGDRYRVTASRLHVREGPGTGFRSQGAIQNNEIVTAIGVNDTGTWRQICRDDGLVGWSSARYMALVLPSDDVVGKSYRLSGNLKVREGPGTNFKTMGFLQTDEIVEALESDAEGTWLRIRRTTDGLTGWAWSRYLIRITLPLYTQMVSETTEEPAERVAVSEPPRTLSPDAIALSPDVRFHTTSKEDVQALLALAESPDTDLAQGVCEDIFHAVKTAVSFVIAEVEQGLAIIVQFAEKVVKWIVDTAEKAVAFMEGIFEKIGVVINDVIDWLKFVFDWDDILNTRDHLSKAIRDVLDLIGTKIAKAVKKPAQQFFETQKNSVVKSLNDAISALGGRPDADGSASQASSGKGFEGQSDTLDWILSKVLGSGQGGLSFASDTIGTGGFSANFENFWASTVTNGLGAAVALPTGLGEVCFTLLKNPDEPLLAVQDLLSIVRDVIVDLLNLGETIAVGLLDFAEELIEKIKTFITADIRLPFISDLIEWMEKESLTLGFSLLDATTLILAIPVTAVYKAMFHEAPFREPPHLAQELDQGWQRGFLIASGIAGVANAIISGLLDLKPENPTKSTTSPNGGTSGWELASLIFSVVGLLPSISDWWQTGEYLKQQETGTRDDYIALTATDILSILDTIEIVLDLVFLVTDGRRMKRSEENKHLGIKIAVGFGIVRELTLLGKVIGEGAKALLDVVAALPQPFSFLRLNPGYPTGNYILVGIDIVAGVAGVVSTGFAISDLNNP